MSEAGKYKVNLKYLVPKSKEVSELMGSCQKDTEASLKTLTGQSWENMKNKKNNYSN